VVHETFSEGGGKKKGIEKASSIPRRYQWRRGDNGRLLFLPETCEEGDPRGSGGGREKGIDNLLKKGEKRGRRREEVLTKPGERARGGGKVHWLDRKEDDEKGRSYPFLKKKKFVLRRGMRVKKEDLLSLYSKDTSPERGGDTSAFTARRRRKKLDPAARHRLVGAKSGFKSFLKRGGKKERGLGKEEKKATKPKRKLFMGEKYIRIYLR